MIASCGLADVLLAYPSVGPNCHRLAKLAGAYHYTRFGALADSLVAVQQLSAAMVAMGAEIDVLLDVDVGMHRTGIPPDERAVDLYQQIAQLPGLQPGGLHAYDGHNNQENLADRQAAIRDQFAPVLALRSRLEKKGLSVPRLIAGGTPTFTVCASLDWPGLECSPGTFVLHDHGYSTRYPDLGFTPAALLLTRVRLRIGSRSTLVTKPSPATRPPANAASCSIYLNINRSFRAKNIWLSKRRRPITFLPAIRFTPCLPISVRPAPCIVRRWSWKTAKSRADGTSSLAIAF